MFDKFQILQDKEGFYIADEDGIAYDNRSFTSYKDAKAELDRLVAEDIHAKRIADHVDGYDRDDLGESPDY